MLIDLAWVSVAWLGVNHNTRQRLISFLWLIPVMPFYRMVVFWFRISGFLHAVAEPGTWRVQDPLVQLEQGVANLRDYIGNALDRSPVKIPVLQERFGGRNPADRNEK
jgi:hypothetical protein